MTGSVPRVRSALFVPAHRADVLAAAGTRGADAVILDLEDGVPARELERARAQARSWAAARDPRRRPAVLSRVHRAGHPALEEDLAAVVVPGLLGVLLPKVDSPADVLAVADRLAWLEGREAIPLGTVRIWPLLESAAAVLAAEDIAACSPRIAFLGGAAAEGGDLAADIGHRTTGDAVPAGFPTGWETLHLRSRVLLASRAAGVPNPMTGLVTTLDELGAVESFARQSRALGYDGMMVIHPAHVPVVNRVFDPTPAEVAAARATLAALDAGGAQRVDGRMVDTAMSAAAARLLASAGETDT
jgi:citrate lyase subunit beta/citryl-CoA lyase